MNIKVELIQSFMKKYGIKPYTLCGLCNISRRSLQNVFNNSKNTKYNTLKQIAQLMEVEVEYLIEK